MRHLRDSTARAACSSHLHLCGRTDWLRPADPASNSHLYSCGQSVVVGLSAPCKGATLHYVLQGGQSALVHANGGTARILWGAWGRPDASRGVLRCGSLCPPAGMLVMTGASAAYSAAHLPHKWHCWCACAGTLFGSFAADMPAALASCQSRQKQPFCPSANVSSPVAVQVISHTLEVVPHKIRPGHSIQQRQVELPCCPGQPALVQCQGPHQAQLQTQGLLVNPKMAEPVRCLAAGVCPLLPAIWDGWACSSLWGLRENCSIV